MALNGSDRKFIEDVAHNLRLRFEDRSSYTRVEQETFDGQKFNVLSDDASTPVVITKEDLRTISGRQLVRDAYLNEVAAAFNQKNGIVASADLDKGLVYAHAEPDAKCNERPMGLSQLESDAKRAVRNLADKYGEED